MPPALSAMTIARLAENPDTAALGSTATVAAGGMIAVGVVVALVLWFFIARRGSNIARWILVIFTVFAIGSLAIGYRLPIADPNLDLSVTAGVRMQRSTSSAMRCGSALLMACTSSPDELKIPAP